MPSSYIFLNNLRLHYYNWNISSPEPAVLLLHGLASNARIWEKTAPYLADAGLRVYALDQRGHGLSDKPDDGYQFADMRRDIAAFIEACHLERPYIIGHSWGAMTALDYASFFAVGPRNPRGIALVDGGIGQLNDGPDADWETVRQRLTPPPLAGMALAEFSARLEEFGAPWGMDEQDMQIILANFDIDEDERISPRLTFERHMQIVRAMWEFPTYERFARLNCPALALPARPAEPHTPRQAEYLAQRQHSLAHITTRCPQVQVNWMVDSIHDIPLQRPQALAEAILAWMQT